jgi:hypothetical protein
VALIAVLVAVVMFIAVVCCRYSYTRIKADQSIFECQKFVDNNHNGYGFRYFYIRVNLERFYSVHNMIQELLRLP